MTANNLKNQSIYFLRGFGQVIFQANACSGIFFLIGIAVNSLPMCAGAIIGAVASMVSAKLIQVDQTDFEQGLYGYNGALAGMAPLLFYTPSVTLLMLVIIAGVSSSIMMRTMLRWTDTIPPYTAPFIISTWGVLIAANLLSLNSVHPESVLLQGGELASLARGIGQVLFQDNWFSGGLFVVGVALHSRVAASWAIIGSGGGMLLANVLGFPDNLVTLGIYGFSASLVAIALADRFAGKTVIPFIGIIGSVMLTRGFQLADVGAFTAPFVLSAWLVIVVVLVQQKRQLKTL